MILFLVIYTEISNISQHCFLFAGTSYRCVRWQRSAGGTFSFLTENFVEMG